MQLTRSLTRAARIHADKTATIFGERRRTWKEIGERIPKLAGYLRSLGVRKSARVAILSHSTDRYLESVFATLWAGGITVPLSTRALSPEIADLINDADAEVLFIGDDFIDIVPALRKACPALQHFIYIGELTCPSGMADYEMQLAKADPVSDSGRTNNDIAAIYYTGGTTGRSKGVMLSHANIYANAMQSLVHFRYDAETVYLHAGPLYHLAAGSRIFTNTLLGATHVMIPRFSPETVLDAIEKYRTTMTALVPTMMGMLLHHPRFATADVSSLQLITYGGSPIPEALIAELVEKLPHVRFGQAYGMTELSPACTYLEPHHHTLEPAKRHLLRSAGKPALGVDIRIVDANDHDVPAGDIGEIIVAGPIVMQGYWKQPELTQQVLRGGYMHTGDLGMIDNDGFVYIMDRLKDMIVTGGENVYSIEIEDALRKHPSVSMCAVIGIPHETWGEAIHAVVVLRDNADHTAEDMIAHCRTLLAGYKVPRSIEFRKEMPLSAANKILKSELRKPFWHSHKRNVS